MQHDERAQLNVLLEEEEARLKYEAEKAKRVREILGQVGRSDDQVRATLEKAGVNVAALDEEFSQSVQRMREARKELAKIPPPPPKKHRRDRLILQKLRALASFSNTTIVYPPAVASSGPSEYCGFNLPLGEINVKAESNGSGWGWGAGGFFTHNCTLWFVYYPPANGELTLEPHIECKGSVYFYANDHWWTNTRAEAQVKIHFDLFQHYWDGEVIYTLIDEYCEDCLKIYEVDEEPPLSKSLSVSAGHPVWIKLNFSFITKAFSSSAFVSLNFREGSQRRIRVDHIVARLETDQPFLVHRPFEGT